MVSKKSEDLLVWIDLEMTGLDPETCAIVELAMILTDPELNQVAEPLELAIWQPDSVLEQMDPFVRDMHTGSGLLERVRASQVSVAQAEIEVMKLLTQHCGYRRGRLAGNSIGQDKRFIARYMPLLDGYLHYRVLDVSTVKELARWWHHVEFHKPTDGQHTALVDIQNSIAELAYYRGKVFR